MHLFFFLYVMQKQKKREVVSSFFFLCLLFPWLVMVSCLFLFFFPFCFHVQRDVKLFFCCSLSHVTRTNT